MGESKLLLPWQDGTVVSSVAQALAVAGVVDVLAVTGGYSKLVEPYFDSLGVQYVRNRAYATDEMVSSLQVGLRALLASGSGRLDGLLVMPGDMPLIDSEVIERVVEVFSAEPHPLITAPVFQGRRGHPVIFGRTLFQDLLALDHAKGEAPRDLLRRNADKITLVPVATEAIHIDLDDRETYQRWHARHHLLQSAVREAQTQHTELTMSQTFQALVVEETEPKKFSRSVQTRTLDDLPEGDVLIRVDWSSLNYKDALSASGNRGVTRNFPHTPGIDLAGTVVSSSDARFREGDAVVVIGYDLGMNTPGGYGQYARVSAEWVVALPDGLTTREAMIIGTAGFTAAMCVDQLIRHDVTPDRGEILVTGATGGVGSVAVALLSQLGYRVVAATGKVAEQSDYLTGLGAESIISREEATDKSRPMLRARWAGVVDTVGGEMLETALAMTQPLGCVTICGLVASANINTTVLPFIIRGISMVGIDSPEQPIADRRRIWNMLATEWKLPNLDTMAREVGLADVDSEIDRILAGQQVGRVLVNMQ